MEVLKKYWLVVTFAILMFLGFQNVSVVFAFLGTIYTILSPIFIGFCIAFILEMPVSFFEKRLQKIPLSFRRGTSICVVFLLVIGFFVLLSVFMIPPIVDSVAKILSNLQAYTNNLGRLMTEVYETLHIESDVMLQLRDGLKNIALDVTKFTVDTTYHLLSKTFEITGALFKWMLAIFFSMYMLSSKERLIGSCRRLVYAVCSSDFADYLDEIEDSSTRIFKNFIVGEFVVAGILGVLCFVGMSLFGFPFAHLISTIIAITALIPYVGGFIGPIPSVILILLVDPPSAIGFMIFIVILNLISGNVIVPKIVGDAIGFDGFWVMVAITVGGGLFGMSGMLFGVPVLAIIHAIFGEFIRNLLLKKLTPEQFGKLYEDKNPSFLKR